jgi:hypothetical protein
MARHVRMNGEKDPADAPAESQPGTPATTPTDAAAGPPSHWVRTSLIVGTVTAVIGALTGVIGASPVVRDWFATAPAASHGAGPPSAQPFSPQPTNGVPVPTTTATWPVPKSSGRTDVLAVHTSVLSPDSDCPEVLPGRVYPHPIQQLSGFGSALDSGSPTVLQQWATRYGGVSATYQKLTTTIQGLGRRAVLLTSLEIQLTRRAPPLAGTHLLQLIGGCGEQAVRAFAADLDQPTPYPQPLLRRTGEITERRISAFPFRITDTDPEYLELYVFTLGCDCSWAAILHWTADGMDGSTVLLDGGQPFRVTSTQRAPAYTYSRGTKQYERATWADYKPVVPVETAPPR